MVFVHFKVSEKNNFIIDCPSDTKVSDLLTTIIYYNNIRIYLDRLVWSVQELANKGVLKPAELQAVSYEDYQKSPEEFAALSAEKLQYAKKPKFAAPFRYVADKNNQRHGVILAVEEQQKLLNAVKIGKSAIQPRRESIQIKQILQAIQNIRLAMMMAYPGYVDLPEWEPSVLLLEQKLVLQVLESQTFPMYDERSILWWAGKQLDKTKRISEYSGKNEKTKIIVKAQKAGGEQPLREPPVDQKTYQQMVKYYYKKVDESKQFDNRAVESVYQQVPVSSMKEKVHIGDEIRFKAF